MILGKSLMLAASCLALMAGTASGAATRFADIDVTAVVEPACAITTNAVDFGSIDPTRNIALDASGSIEVTCTAGTSWTAGAGAGENPRVLGTFSIRRMAGQNSVTPALLAYRLFTDGGRTTEWRTPTLLSGVGTGLAQSIPVYGEIPTGQTTTPVDVYRDIVTVDLEY